MGKSPLKSKTFWTNILAVGAMVVQSQTGFVVGPEYQVAALSLVNMVLRAVTREPLDWGQIGNKVPLVLFLLCSLSMTPMLSACGALKVVEEKPVLAELTVRVAAARVLEEHPTWAGPARDICADVIRALDESEQVDLGLLEKAVIERVPMERLTPEEQQLVAVLVSAVREEIEAELARKGVEVPEEARVRVAAVVGWIYQVADARLQSAEG